jgi:hypothetical protein
MCKMCTLRRPPYPGPERTPPKLFCLGVWGGGRILHILHLRDWHFLILPINGKLTTWETVQTLIPECHGGLIQPSGVIGAPDYARRFTPLLNKTININA